MAWPALREAGRFRMRWFALPRKRSRMLRSRSRYGPSTRTSACSSSRRTAGLRHLQQLLEPVAGVDRNLVAGLLQQCRQFRKAGGL